MQMNVAAMSPMYQTASTSSFSFVIYSLTNPTCATWSWTRNPDCSHVPLIAFGPIARVWL